MNWYGCWNKEEKREKEMLHMSYIILLRCVRRQNRTCEKKCWVSGLACDHNIQYITSKYKEDVRLHVHACTTWLEWSKMLRFLRSLRSQRSESTPLFSFFPENFQAILILSLNKVKLIAIEMTLLNKCELFWPFSSLLRKISRLQRTVIWKLHQNTSFLDLATAQVRTIRLYGVRVCIEQEIKR